MAATQQNSESLPQASAVPYRQRDGETEFCIITSSEGRWMFPKGFIEMDESAEEAALKEAHEEAGLHGRIVGGRMGLYHYVKASKQMAVSVFLMLVSACDEHWDEEHLRQRRWVSGEEARGLLAEAGLRELLDKADTRIRKSR